MALISPQTAENMRNTGWTVAYFALALFFFTWVPFTALVILGMAIGKYLFGDAPAKARVKGLGLNPFNWMQAHKFLWFVFGVEVMIGIAFALGAYVPVITPAIASFYIALWPTMVMMNYIGLCALGLALLIGLAYLILKPSDPLPQQYMVVPVYQGHEVPPGHFRQGYQAVPIAQPDRGYWEGLGPGYVLEGDQAVPVALPVDGQQAR